MRLRKNFDIPIAVGGVTPSLSPNVVIEHPSIDMIIQGEGEVAFKELVIALKNKTSLSKVPNLWYKDNGKVIRNKLTRYMELDKLPYQELDFWDKRHFNKPYNGVMYNMGSFDCQEGVCISVTIVLIAICKLTFLLLKSVNIEETNQLKVLLEK